MVNLKQHIVKCEGQHVLWKETPNAVPWTDMAYQTWFLMSSVHLKDGEIRRVNITVSDD